MALADLITILRLSLPYVVSLFSKRLAQLPASYIHRLTYKAHPNQKCIVIIGGSFAGITLAKRLCETLPGDYKVILVEKNTHFFFPFVFPRFSVVPGHEPKAFIPYDEILSGGRNGVPEGIFERRADKAVEITRDSVLLASGEAISCEYIILATGTSSSYPSKLASTGKNGACEELRSMQSRIRGSNSVAIVGGGAVGVELATDIASYYPGKQVTVFHSRDRLMNGYGPRLHEKTLASMEELGIDTRLGVRPRILGPDKGCEKRMQTVQLPDGSLEHFDLVVSNNSSLVIIQQKLVKTDTGPSPKIPCTGQAPNSELVANLSPGAISPRSGHVRVRPTLQIDAPVGGLDHLFAVGDVADTGGPKMGRAAVAQVQVVADNILAMVSGSPPRRVYTPHRAVEGSIHLTLGMVGRVLRGSKRGHC